MSSKYFYQQHQQDTDKKVVQSSPTTLSLIFIKQQPSAPKGHMIGSHRLHGEHLLPSSYSSDYPIISWKKSCCQFLFIQLTELPIHVLFEKSHIVHNELPSLLWIIWWIFGCIQSASNPPMTLAHSLPPSLWPTVAMNLGTSAYTSNFLVVRGSPLGHSHQESVVFGARKNWKLQVWEHLPPASLQYCANGCECLTDFATSVFLQPCAPLQTHATNLVKSWE